jgi:hypothetical protein
VTETVSDRAPAKVLPLAPPVADPATVAMAARRAQARNRAGWSVFGGLVVALLAISAAACIPRGRRRRWRPGRQRPVVAASVDDDIAGSYHVPLTTKEAFLPPSVGNRR